MSTVGRWLMEQPARQQQFDAIIFDVFTDEDADAYAPARACVDAAGRRRPGANRARDCRKRPPAHRRRRRPRSRRPAPQPVPLCGRLCAALPRGDALRLSHGVRGDVDWRRRPRACERAAGPHGEALSQHAIPLPADAWVRSAPPHRSHLRRRRRLLLDVQRRRLLRARRLRRRAHLPVPRRDAPPPVPAVLQRVGLRRAAARAINAATNADGECTDLSLAPDCPRCGSRWADGGVLPNLRGGDWFIHAPYEAAQARLLAWLDESVEQRRAVAILEIEAAEHARRHPRARVRLRVGAEGQRRHANLPSRQPRPARRHAQRVPNRRRQLPRWRDTWAALAPLADAAVALRAAPPAAGERAPRAAQTGGASQPRRGLRSGSSATGRSCSRSARRATECTIQLRSFYVINTEYRVHASTAVGFGIANAALRSTSTYWRS